MAKKRLIQYQIVIAETLLQRTKAETVAKFYRHFIKDYPNWKALSEANVEVIQEYLKPIGLYKQRSKRLKSLALEMVMRKGKLPQERSDLESIPYIGQYIANSIELIIHGKPLPLVDVNMARLLERYFGERKMADIRYDKYLQRLSFKAVQLPRAKDLNWAILDYAAIVCKARNPACNRCQIRAKCLYFNNLN